MKLTDEQLSQVVQWLSGTCNSLHRAEDHFGFQIDVTDLEDQLLDQNIEMCKGCGWWFESGNLVPDAEEDIPDGFEDELIGYCEDCRRETSAEMQRDASDQSNDQLNTPIF